MFKFCTKTLLSLLIPIQICLGSDFQSDEYIRSDEIDSRLDDLILTSNLKNKINDQHLIQIEFMNQLQTDLEFYTNILENLKRKLLQLDVLSNLRESSYYRDDTKTPLSKNFISLSLDLSDEVPHWIHTKDGILQATKLKKARLPHFLIKSPTLYVSNELSISSKIKIINPTDTTEAGFLISFTKTKIFNILTLVKSKETCFFQFKRISRKSDSFKDYDIEVMNTCQCPNNKTNLFDIRIESVDSMIFLHYNDKFLCGINHKTTDVYTTNVGLISTQNSVVFSDLRIADLDRATQVLSTSNQIYVIKNNYDIVDTNNKIEVVPDHDLQKKNNKSIFVSKEQETLHYYCFDFSPISLLDSNFIHMSNAWQLVNDDSEDDNSNSANAIQANNNAKSVSLILINGWSCDDFDISTDIFFLRNGRAGFILFYQNDNQYYTLTVETISSMLYLHKKTVNDTYILINFVSLSSQILKQTRINLRASRNKDNVELYLNNAEVFQFNMSENIYIQTQPLSFGLCIFEDSSAIFSHIKFISES